MEKLARGNDKQKRAKEAISRLGTIKDMAIVDDELLKRNPGLGPPGAV